MTEDQIDQLSAVLQRYLSLELPTGVTLLPVGLGTCLRERAKGKVRDELLRCSYNDVPLDQIETVKDFLKGKFAERVRVVYRGPRPHGGCSTRKTDANRAAVYFLPPNELLSLSYT